MTYVVLSVAVLALLAAATLPTLRRLPHRPLLLTALMLVALTAVFDPIIVAAGIVDYDEALISGARLAGAPVEDVAYALGTVMLVPTLWTLLTSRDAHHA
ncbi:lycopene cyclase domain-containing protein [Demequina gelatinilytica]|uniref:lycopene cyclase domain-containing protein n=1 Tax=Demequina gelatinilytica TaxID=1638980 RepID=UPI000783A95B|nr:lycopene cyclase domain-containing protein [Demequina gelatinilytica]